MTTTTNHTAYLGRTPYGERIFVQIKVETTNQATTTVEHENVSQRTRISVMGFGVRPRGRSVSFGGQIEDEVRNLLRPAANVAAGWTRDDIASLLDIWDAWHLSDMRAGCAHMDLPADRSYDARQNITCWKTGYRYGTAWLYVEPPASVLAEIERLVSLPTGKIPHYV